MFWNDEKTSIRWNTQEYMETKLIHLVMCEVHYMKCSRVLGALMGHMKDRHAWHRSAVRYREHEKFWREGPKDLTCYEKKMNEGITEHSTRCFQCPPQGVAPCGALLPFEGTLKRKGLDQKIRNYANENKNTWRSLSNIHEYRNHGSQYPPQGVSPCGTLLLLLRRGIEMKWTPFIHY